MILKTEQFKEVASTILYAVGVDKTAGNLELKVDGTTLFLNLTNNEYYVSYKFPLETPEVFEATVEAALFLNLISNITVETFMLTIADRTVVIKAGKSTYKVPLIYDNAVLMTLPKITLTNVTVEMPISNDILQSILNVNSRELSKVKNLDVNELQRLYYIDETGCFTFTNGACLNSFTLEKPVKLLLNEQIVKLFKLFNEDVAFKFGHDSDVSGVKTKVVFETSNIYVAAIINCDDLLINTVQGPCAAVKGFVSTTYSNHVVVSAADLSSAISRLILFTKNSGNNKVVPATIVLKDNEIHINDLLQNEEVIAIENDSYIEEGYNFTINLVDLKLAVDSFKNEHITINCGNHRSVVISCGAINSLVPEGRRN